MPPRYDLRLLGDAGSPLKPETGVPSGTTLQVSVVAAPSVKPPPLVAVEVQRSLSLNVKLSNPTEVFESTPSYRATTSAGVPGANIGSTASRFCWAATRPLALRTDRSSSC